MAQLNELINYRLSTKGLTPVEISRFIKDVFNLVEYEQEKTFVPIHRKLAALGWSEHILGEHDLELIRLYWEMTGDKGDGSARA